MARSIRWRSRDEPQSFLAFALNAPAILVLLGMMVYPVAYSAWLSLHRYNLRRPRAMEFAGFGNYADILADPLFWRAAKTTALFSLGSIGLTITVGTLLALLLNERFPGRGLLRAVTLIPWAIPPVVNGLVWQWLFEGRYGLINAILLRLGVIDTYQAWLSQPATALPALVVAQVWNHVPFVAIVMLAALQTIPDELYDAARVDGANVFQRFGFVTLPWLSHSLLLVLITQTMVALRTFDIIYVLTGGGPLKATQSLSIMTYEQAFGFFKMGYASAIGVITLIVCVIASRLMIARAPDNI